MVSFNGYANNEATELKNNAANEITEAIIESKSLNARLDSLNEFAPKNKINVTESQQSIASLITESEKLNEDAYKLRKAASTKTGEEREKDIAEAKN